MKTPTNEETKMLINYTSKQLGGDVMEAKCLVQRAHIGIVDGYMPDCPGYCGKVMIVLWPGGVDLVEVFELKDSLTKVEVSQ